MVSFKKLDNFWWATIKLDRMTISKHFTTKYQAESWASGVEEGFKAAIDTLTNIAY